MNLDEFGYGGSHTFVAVETAIISFFIGIFSQSFWKGFLSFFIIAALFGVPVISGVMTFLISIVDASILGALLLEFSSLSIIAVWWIDLISFLFFIGVHMSVSEMSEKVTGYSLIISESLLATLFIYMQVKDSYVLVIAMLIGLVVFSLIPVIRGVISIGLGLFTLVIFASLFFEEVPKGHAIAMTVVLCSVLVYFHVRGNEFIDYKGIRKEKEMKKQLEADMMRNWEIQRKVYKKFPEVERIYYYFNNAICENDDDRMLLEYHWIEYMNYIQDMDVAIPFEQYFEMKKLYRNGEYSKDFLRRYEEYRNTKGNQEGGNHWQETDDSSESTQSSSAWFKGVKTVEELQKRYRSLLKIYHPDNQCGDTKISQEIQAEYEKLCMENKW